MKRTYNEATAVIAVGGLMRSRDLPPFLGLQFAADAIEVQVRAEDYSAWAVGIGNLELQTVTWRRSHHEVIGFGSVGTIGIQVLAVKPDHLISSAEFLGLVGRPFRLEPVSA